MTDWSVSEREIKYVLEEPRVPRFLRDAAQHLEVETHDPFHPVAYSRTTYLDTDDLGLLRSPDAVRRRLRIREYAAAPDLLTSPTLTGVSFLELKESNEGRRSKARVRLPAAKLRQLLEGSAPPAELDDLGLPIHPAVHDCLRSQKVRPWMTTWYRRTSLVARGLRVTLDHGVSFCEPSCLGDRGAFAIPAHTVAVWPATVLEVKLTGALPDWLAAQLATMTQAINLSKFEAGMRVLGARDVQVA